ncbi:TPA: type VI secretion system contractile sheath small subunit [Enterobacter hormaechei subsp. steigerwaltii]|nr:type VI secretion system contractile sheath small subunit [Enterobacter hormaechei subsp. steigerwaltii]
MSESFQSEIPKARVNIKLDLFTNGAKKKTELPLKLLSVGDFSNGKATGTLSERNKISVDKNNFDSVLGELNPELKLAVKNTLANDGSEESVHLSFRNMKDFEPEQVARQIPQLKAMLAMRNLLRDLKSNLLDNITFKKELEAILRDPSLSEELRNELNALAPSQD